MIPIPRHSRADVAGMLLSAVCMMHCLLLPALVAWGIGGAIAGYDSEWTHIVMLGFVLPVSGLALAGGWLRHRRVAVLALGVAGVVCLALAAFVVHPHLGATADALVTTLGGALLATAHWRNRDCSCPHTRSPGAASLTRA